MTGALTGWKSTKWGALATLEYGKGLREYDGEVSEDRPYRVYGTNGPIGWHSSYLWPKPGIVVGRKGAYRGIHFSSQPFFVIDTAFYLRPIAEFDIKWAYYQLRAFDINKIDSGSAIPSTSRGAFYEIPVSLPPLLTQRKIAAILSAYDDLIEVNTRRIAILEEMARGLYREWFVRYRFPGHEGVRMVESAVGLAPEGWAVKKLGDVVELAYGKGLKADTRMPGTVPVYGSAGIVGYHNVSLVKGPGIIVGRKGNVGSVFWSDADFFPIDTVFYVQAKLELHYVFYALRNQHFINSDAAVPGLSRNQAYLNPFLVPDQDTMNTFAKFIVPIFAQTSNLRQRNANLRRTRDLLLPRLVSGEVEVGDLDHEVAKEREAPAAEARRLRSGLAGSL